MSHLRAGIVAAALFIPALAVHTAAAQQGAADRYGPAEIVASGRVEPVELVDVGAELSGRITEILADFNDEVAAGDVLARLDSATYRARLEEAEARLTLAEAKLAAAEAARDGTRARLAEANANFARKQELSGTGTASGRDLDLARANRDAARSAVAAAEAEVAVERAAVRIAKAGVSQARSDLMRTDIRAPIDGVVIDRKVERGQTVAASLQTPTLFTIAGKLSRVNIKAFVDEADIGRVRQGQRARFRVDAYPGRAFEGRVLNVRRAPKEIQNVVVYTVVIGAANPERVLFPGMTAEVRISLDEDQSG